MWEVEGATVFAGRCRLYHVRCPRLDGNGRIRINDSGEVVGIYSIGETEYGFVFSGGTYTTILVPGSDRTQVLGINDSGQLVGDYSVSSIPQTDGFLASPTTVPEPGALISTISALSLFAAWGWRLRHSRQSLNYPA
jgi:hypothetical protein